MISSAPLASAQAIGLPESAMAAIQRVLATYPVVEAAILYGSRALGRHRSASDIDLTLTGHAISNATMARIDADLDDLLLPWMIDLSALVAIRHPALLDHIQGAGVLLYQCADSPTFPA
ncbi:nucleotidyltransferase domain-containing protein [Synechococcus sp. BA-132 BA5]|uniref:nucleotidyltransferase domain-containing protein n=1 Tax=Synechococcus sp. BA-132 BA5 TaxID=3110252 RepID=UPI002B207B49|nr:nucleotidyltransferase domain-containing protein [Synechococcus sp. BA-132 BA5]MEA5416401.1 nucleotidyltransferase domain-containing protein [Synechococcus sp. BA-132 BA5]